MRINTKSAIVLHSGGQDSTTCLVWALKRFKRVHTISFDYGQRHARELVAAKTIARRLKIDHKIIKIEFLKALTHNALTDRSVKVKAGTRSHLPTTFVPGRNLIFLTAAAIYAKQKNIPNLVTGVCQTDYSGYPDCRASFIKSIEKSLRLAMEFPFSIHTPLMYLTKAQSIKLMQRLGGLPLLKYTHTCYHGKRQACGKCPACKLRLKGFREAGIKDHLTYEK